jgi:uncharacterized protein YgbK (DUF1537 family)
MTASRTSLLLSFYGDDVTGSTATAEALTVSDVPTILFMKPPTLPFLKRHFPGVRAVGVAGTSRSFPTKDLEPLLKPVYRRMKSYGAPLFLYKICSTFDSSPAIGSIGRAIEVGRDVFASAFVPILAAAPRLGRYTLFGNHFVHLSGEVYRLDRHPSMSTHPITPMDEADLRRHLSKQTELPCGLVSVLDFEKGRKRMAQKLQDLLNRRTPLILFDTMTNHHLDTACSVIWDHTDRTGPLFAVGSQEWGYGLARVWKQKRLLRTRLTPSDRQRRRSEGALLVVSGSCASMNGRQIEWATQHGLTGIAVNPERLLNLSVRKAESDRILGHTLSALQAEGTAVIHTAIGPEDTRIRRTKRAAEALGLSPQAVTDILGQVLGDVIRQLLRRTAIRRLVLAGGDVSGKISQALGIWALQVGAPVGIAAPLCYAYSSNPRVMGLEIAFKGGQIGDDAYFESVRAKPLSEFRRVSMGRF